MTRAQAFALIDVERERLRPDGVEKALQRNNMPDLIARLDRQRYAIRRELNDGNGAA